MTTIDIPGTLDEMRAVENTTSKRIAKDRWARAARVYAATYETTKGGDRRSDDFKAKSSFERMTCEQYAELRFFGLASKDTVRKHRDNWQWAIDNGLAAPVYPGDVNVALPAIDYPPTGNSHGIADDVKADAPVEKKVAAIQKLIASDPDVEKRMDDAFVQKAAQNPVLAHRVAVTRSEHRPSLNKPTPRTALDMASVIGVGAAIVADINRYAERVAEYADLLRERGDDPAMRETVDRESRNFEIGSNTLREYDRTLRVANGRDPDAVAARLLQEMG